MTLCELITRRFSSDTSAVGKEYKVSDIVSTLGTTLFLFGYFIHLLI